MKIKDYFNNPRHAECPFCNVKLNPTSFNICEHYDHVRKIFYMMDDIWIKVAIDWFSVLFFKDMMIINDGTEVILRLPFDSLNCDRDLKDVNEAWVNEWLIFS